VLAASIALKQYDAFNITIGLIGWYLARELKVGCPCMGRCFAELDCFVRGTHTQIRTVSPCHGQHRSPLSDFCTVVAGQGLPFWGWVSTLVAALWYDYGTYW